MNLEVMDAECFDRDDAGVVSSVATPHQSADTALVHAGACCGIGEPVPGRLLGDERRKAGWMRAEAAGDAGPWRQQVILGRGRWDGDDLRDVVRK